ncbi:putative transcription initiation factor TFIID subunit 8 [Citrobacter freundii]|nr:putative transcription initiation factor TFIID subunit 8 [Citrobacter freundii]
MTVAPGPVVEHFNVIEDIRPGQIPGFVYSLPDTFFFQ